MKEHLLVRALKGETVERVPVWAMRQAGRWDPAFAKLRGGIGFYEFANNVPLATEASLLPRRFGVDAIILFYDITTLAVAMGLPFELRSERGPVPEKPVRTLHDVQRLAARPDPDRYRPVIDLLKAVCRELDGELPVLVFAGAPFTLASYCIGAGKDLETTRSFAAEQSATWAALLERLAEATMDFLNQLTARGASAYQLFDSWAGQLSADEYDRWALRFQREVFRGATDTPRVLFVKECPFVDAMAASGADCISLGTTHDLASLRAKYPGLVWQGNVADQLVRTGTPDQVIRATLKSLGQGGGRRHVLNLSHGMNRDTPPENFAAFVATARGYGR